MFPAPFDYHRATSLAHAQELIAAHPDAKLLAGGHSLIPLLKLRLATPDTLIDIGRVPELAGITRDGGTLRVGALCTHASIAASADVRAACPTLAEAASQVGDAQVRNRGTIGGNIAHADPASDLPTVLVAHDAAIVVQGSGGERSVAASDFFQGLMATALGEGEIVRAVHIAAVNAGTGTAYVKFVHPASRYAVIGVAAVRQMSGGTCQAARVAIGGLVPASVRLPAVESVLAGQAITAESASAAAAKASGAFGDDVLGDVFASAEYRAAVAPVWIARAITAAAARAR
ncbi:MAG: xanthine dehydrogenase family protein subunit M [Vicinamibacterales bacterium]